MKFKKYSSEGLVLSRRNLGEADRILDIFTKDFGKISVVAKGVRKPKSRKRGSLEVFSLIRFSASKGKSLDILTEVEIISSFNNLRKDLRKVALAYFFMEVVNKTTKEEEKSYELFDQLRKYLNLLEKKSPKLKKIKKKFVFDTLVLQGYWPREKTLSDEDRVLEEVTERKLSSSRVGRKVLT